jgi:hypothetical protein
MSDKLSKILNDSVWIVPKETLLAYSVNEDVVVPVKDQTIWVINSCKDNYVFGTSYLTINNVFISKNKIIGSITPCGDVLFTFYSNTETTTGYGKFLKTNGKYQFLMQMNTINNSMGLSHWSYMIKINKCDPEYKNIPGTNFGVDELSLL